MMQLETLKIALVFLVSLVFLFWIIRIDNEGKSLSMNDEQSKSDKRIMMLIGFAFYIITLVIWGIVVTSIWNADSNLSAIGNALLGIFLLVIFELRTRRNDRYLSDDKAEK